MKKACAYLFALLTSLLNGQEQFTNNGYLKIYPGTSVTVFGNFINNGSFIDSSAIINLAGSSAQQIGGTSNSVFNNLTLKNISGSYLSSDQSIRGELNIASGTFSTTGYNFTLISDINGTARIAPILGDLSGNITMQRYLGTGPNGWRFLASPVKGVTINDWQDDFITSGFPGSLYPAYSFTSVYSYDESVPGIYDNGYVSPNSANDSVKPGTGFWCYIGPVPLTVDVTGPPVKFTHTFNVTYSPSSGSIDDGWQMIGNPYPSSIDWDSPAWTKQNVNSAIYIWNPANQQFASWVAGTGVNGGSNIIASSQSFWIQTSGTNPVLTCNENVKSSTDRAFLRPSNTFQDKLKLKFEGNGYVDEALIRFGGNSTNGYDNDVDARKAFSSNWQVPGLCSVDSTLSDMSINSLPLLSSAVQIPVKTLVGVSGTYTLSIDSSSSFPQGACVILEDLVTGMMTDITIGASYSFMIEDTTKAPRFLIRMYPPHNIATINASCNKRADGKAIATAKGVGPWNYLWLDSSANIIKSTQSSFFPDTLQNLTAGNYTLQVSDINGYCGLSKSNISISEPTPVIADFSLLRDTIFAGAADSALIVNTSTGAATYFWDFGDGQTDSVAVPAVHHYSLTGTYRIKLRAEFNSCADTMSKLITVRTGNPVDIHEASLQGLKIFPNPNNGVFYIHLNDFLKEEASLRLSTITGEQVYESTLKTSRSEIDVKNLAKGVYLYQLQLQQKVVAGKLIIQ